MTDAYRLDPPEIPPAEPPAVNPARFLEAPLALDENSAEVVRNYVYFLLPFFSVISFLIVGIASRGDNCWLVLAAVGAYLCWRLPQSILPIAILAGLGIIFGPTVVHYAGPLLVLAILSRSFRDHYVWFSSGYPMRLEEGARLRSSLTAIIGKQKLPRGDRRTRKAAFREALQCWFTYNTAAAADSGILDTPAGTVARRVSLTCCGILALAVLMVRPLVDFHPSPVQVLGKASSAHLADELYRERAEATFNVMSVTLTMFAFPTVLLLQGFKVLHGRSLCAAYSARQHALAASPEEKYAILLERLDHAFALDHTDITASLPLHKDSGSSSREL